MPIPTIVFGVLLSTLYGATYHLLRGGSLRSMMIFLALAWAGFWLGDTLGWSMGWSFAAVGNLNTGTASILSFVFILVGDVIRRVNNAQEEK